MTDYRYFKNSDGKICRIHVEQDSEPLNPRYDWDGNIGHMKGKQHCSKEVYTMLKEIQDYADSRKQNVVFVE